MIYINDPKNINIKNSAVCIGNFDGIHKGHQKLISKVVWLAEKHNLNPVVFSFYPHPRAVLNNEDMRFIITSEEKKLLLESLGVKYFIEYPFEHSFSQLQPEEFFVTFLIDMLDCKALVVGEGYKFGRNKSGDSYVLKQLSDAYRILLHIQSHLIFDKEKISSSNIRKWILDSQFDKAEEALGAPYFIKEKVVTGKQIGRQLNFPTANLITDCEKLIPPDGIYATKTNVCGKLYNSVTNIGNNPTVNGKARTIETYVFDFDDIIYGEEIMVYFYKRLRGEIKFSNIEELKRQISDDVLNAKKFFSEKD